MGDASTDEEGQSPDEEPPKSPDELAARLREVDNDDEITLQLGDGTDVTVSVTRSLHLPHSANDDVDGGSLRHAVTADDSAVETLDVPSPEALVAAEESAEGSWTRSRIEFFELVSRTEDGEKVDDYGDPADSFEIAAVEG